MPFAEIVFWHWWVAAVAFMVLEVFAPGTLFLWIGVAAGVVGLLLLVFPEIAWQHQFMVFAAVAVVTVVGWRIYHRKHPTQTDRPTLNRRGEQYVGRILELDQGIVNGSGKVRVDDSTWKVQGADLPAGARVKVIAVEGTVLTVEPA